MIKWYLQTNRHSSSPLLAFPTSGDSKRNLGWLWHLTDYLPARICRAHRWGTFRSSLWSSPSWSSAFLLSQRSPQSSYFHCLVGQLHPLSSTVCDLWTLDKCDWRNIRMGRTSRTLYHQSPCPWMRAAHLHDLFPGLGPTARHLDQRQARVHIGKVWVRWTHPALSVPRRFL